MLALLFAIAHAQDEDPRLWMEEVTGEQALTWVRAQNDVTTKEFTSDPSFEALRGRMLAALDSNARIPYVAKQGEHFYNFWKDAEHPRGVWRRTTFASYRTDAPVWEVILDLDALGAAEGENWVWGGAECLRPAYTRCLIELSRGGADASVVREFDVDARAFVEGGFQLPEAKGSATWIDLDHVFVSTDFGEGTLTESGYPRVTKRWTRGTELGAAETVFEGQTTDISVYAEHDDEPGYERDFVGRGITFYTNELFELTPKGLVKVEKPDDTEASVVRDWILFTPRSDWTVDGTTWPAGSLLAANYPKWKKGKGKLTALFTPDARSSLSGSSFTRDHVVLESLVDVRTVVEVLTPGKKAWTREPMAGLPEFGQVSVWAVDPEETNEVFMTVTDYLTPSSLWYGTLGEGAPTAIKQTPAFFDAAGLEVSQHFATSKDGTKIPYFQVGPKDRPAGAPTLLYGYGGFEVSLLPGYSATTGIGWLERGGTYVVANIRGGGEYGPAWHQAALRENRNKAYEDFAAVGEDLVARGVTTPATLGIQGGSNGGLLMGNMYTMYPDHWGAVVCMVPLLDMKRYTKLLAGASWAGEYGDPDIAEDWAFIQKFSPYHNIDASKDYPPILFATSTRDDRVHPGHARKMAHALIEAGEDVAYYENIEGGHGGAANNEQAAFKASLAFEFLWKELTGTDESAGAPVEGAAPAGGAVPAPAGK